MSAKAALRTMVRDGRRALGPVELAAARTAVRGHVLARADADAAAGRPWQRVFAYEPLATEPGSIELLEALAARGARVFVPVMLADRDLDWVQWGGTTAIGPGAITSATVVIVPAMAVDRSGVRLGRGGGSYDRALARVGPGVEIVALLHRGEFLDRVPAELWDRRVTAVSGPDGWCDVPPAAPASP